MDRAQDVAAQVDDRAAELRLAEVEADQVTAVRGDAEQDRRLAAAGSAAADLLDQVVVDEAADETADGRSRQAGQPGQVGARQRAVVVEGAQDQLLVERSRLLVRGLLRQHRLAGAHGRTLLLPRPADSLPRGFGKRLDKVGWCVRARGFVKSVDKRVRRRRRRPVAGADPSAPRALAQPGDLLGQLGLAGAGALDDRGRRARHERLVGQALAGRRQPALGLGEVALEPLALEVGGVGVGGARAGRRPRSRRRPG